MKARLPGFVSLITLSLFAVILSVVEWFSFRNLIWKNNAFLGELSLEHTLAFPSAMVSLTFLAIAAAAIILSFAGRAQDE
jgi:hypothetical protein